MDDALHNALRTALHRTRVAFDDYHGLGEKKAIYGSPGSPLVIASIEIPCYVLDDGTRVLVQGGVIMSLDMAQGTAAGGGGDRIVKFARTKGLAPFIDNDLANMIKNPIKFRVPSGTTAYGYEATILVKLCDASWTLSTTVCWRCSKRLKRRMKVLLLASPWLA